MNKKYIFTITIIVLLLAICIGCEEEKKGELKAVKNGTEVAVQQGQIVPVLECNPKADQDCCIKHEGTWDKDTNTCNDIKPIQEEKIGVEGELKPVEGEDKPVIEPVE
jgi:hypothetical protein